MARWSRGQSGNPSGRPRGSRNKSTAEIREILDANVSFEDVVRKLFERAKKGNERAAELLLAYAFGKPVGREEVSVEQPSLDSLREDARKSLESLGMMEENEEIVDRLTLVARGVKSDNEREAEN